MSIAAPRAHRDFSIPLSNSGWKSTATKSLPAQNLASPAVAEFLDNVDDGSPQPSPDTAAEKISSSQASDGLVHQRMETGEVVISSSAYRDVSAKRPNLSPLGSRFLLNLANGGWNAGHMSHIRGCLQRPINRAHNLHLTFSQIREFIYCGGAAVHCLASSRLHRVAVKIAVMLLRRSATVVAKLRAHWTEELATKSKISKQEMKLALDAYTLSLSCGLRYTFLNKDTSRAVVTILGEAYDYLSSTLDGASSEFVQDALELIMPKEMLNHARANLAQFKDVEFLDPLNLTALGLPPQGSAG